MNLFHRFSYWTHFINSDIMRYFWWKMFQEFEIILVRLIIKLWIFAIQLIYLHLLLTGPCWWTGTLHWPCLHCCFHWPSVLHVTILASDTVSIFLDTRCHHGKLLIETILLDHKHRWDSYQKTLFIEVIYGWYFFNPLNTVLSQLGGKLFQSVKILNVKKYVPMVICM